VLLAGLQRCFHLFISHKHHLLKYIERETGIEPTTYSLGTWHSENEQAHDDLR
jgi:hypothetical protein